MYYNNDTTVFLDGKWIKAKDASSGMYNQTMHYGNGVFEGIRAYQSTEGSNIFKAKEHFERLIYSAKKMHIKLPYSVEELIQIAYTLLDKNELVDAYIRPLVYAGDSMSLMPSNDSHVFMAAWKWEKYLGDKPLNVMLSSFQRPNPKSCHVEAKVVGHYTNSILATQEAKELGYDEALLLDMHGNVAEGPGANFFYEKDDVLYTPPAGNILPGITRATIIELAKELDITVVEKHFTIDDVYKADNAFFVGTAVEVAPIASINGEKFKGAWEDSAGHNIYLMYRQKVRYNHYQGLTIV
ncbi:branched-chain amino acid transaminase [Fulvivirga lutimaris]|uniref:branched-chain amino acid transaminase n=1 Tax=Fulvivirga lutimaris TaxID=1819566 RepID=UPI0012BCD3CD|nr:branched-chain amino acid transaminase [Fulvivirga lutimaris]MTI38715.1 branched-chain amino acid transaminase [Fulvivirga lutimaris]